MIVNKATAKYQRLGKEGIKGFEWPDSRSDIARIQESTEMFRNLSIEEAFAHAYRDEMNKPTITRLREISGKNECRSLKPGDVIELQVKDITKKGVIFEQNSYKETIISTINLYQYPTFRNFLPKEPLRCKVMSLDVNKIYVDPFQPLIDDFVKEIQETIDNQANINKPIVTRITGLQHMRGGYIGSIRVPAISDLCGKDMYMQAFIPGSQITLNIATDFTKWDGKDVDTFITNLSIRPGTTDVTVACSAKEYLRFLGNLNIIQLFGDYCEGNKAWKEAQEKVHEGNITGICNTSSKTGVFVEIPSMGITGMVPVHPEVINTYKRGPVKVKIVGFVELMKFNEEVDQMQHVEPWKIENGVLKRINVKCVLEFVK